MSDDEYRALQIYAQPCWHEDAYIVGNRKGLEALRDAISRALEIDGPITMSAFVEFDGEGYDLVVCPCEDDDLRMLEGHYTDEMARRDGMSPARLVQAKQK